MMTASTNTVDSVSELSYEQLYRDLSEREISELRLLVETGGWKVLQRLVEGNRFSKAEQILNSEPQPGEEATIYIFRDAHRKGFLKGFLFLMSFPPTLIEAHTPIPEEKKDD